MTKVYVTRWALTRGILEFEGIPSAHPSGFTCVLPGKRHVTITLYHPHWHSTREAAAARANSMRERMIVNLEKRLDKLRAMDPF